MCSTINNCLKGFLQLPYMKNNTNYKFFNKLFLKVSVSVSAKVSAISGIGSIGISIGEYLSIGIGRNFGIGAALIYLQQVLCARAYAYIYVHKSLVINLNTCLRTVVLLWQNNGQILTLFVYKLLQAASNFLYCFPNIFSKRWKFRFILYLLWEWHSSL